MKQILNKFLRKFNVEIHGLGYLQALEKGEFKKSAFEVQQQYIRNQKPVIFDLGANRGDVTEQYLGLFPGCRVYGFEPFPGSLEVFKSRFGNMPNVSAYQLAVADKESILPFYVNKNVDTNSILKPQKTGLSSDANVTNESLIEVNSITLDKFCEENKIATIDILKMDIQGGEWAALKGADRLLKKQSISLIYLESYFVEQYENQPLFHDISKLLHGYGYYLQDIYNPIYGKGSIAWGDMIFLKKQSL